MARRKFEASQIIRYLRSIEVLQGKGKTVTEACREIGITKHTYYKWRKNYGEKYLSIIPVIVFLDHVQTYESSMKGLIILFMYND